MLEFFNEDINLPEIDTEKVSKWILNIIRQYKKREGNLAVIFCSDNYLLQINKEYLNHDYFTDIITFNYNDGNKISGDIFISIDTVQSNASEYNVTFDEELMRVIIHGTLHLLGFDDKTKEQQIIMKQKEDEALNIFYN